MQIYLVGGAVRDQLLNLPAGDNDWVVIGASAEQMLKLGYQQVGRDFPVFIHPKTGEEYALARTERKTGQGYQGFKCHASPEVTLEQDLARRDLSINAMAQDDEGVIIDPYQGQQDLANKLLRHVSPAFVEDPLRVLRVARFYARFAHLGFKVDTSTLKLMQKICQSEELLALSAERIWKETERALAESSPWAYIDLLDQCQALTQLFPEWQEIKPEQLKSLCPQLNNAQEIFSVLLYLSTQDSDLNQSKQSIDSFCKRIRAPKAWQQHALNLRLWHTVLTEFSDLNATDKLALVFALDILRRPELLASIVNASQALSLKKDDLVTELLQLADQLKTIDPQQLIKEGFKGEELGQAIKEKQLDICAQFRFRANL